MATTDYNIIFNKSPALVEYKLDSSSIQPTSPANPTTLSMYPLTFTQGETYNIRISALGPGSCTPGARILTITIPAEGACCPPTYTLSPDESYCYVIEEVAATPPSGGTPDTTVPKSFIEYSRYGTVIYDPGFSLNGVGTNTRISTANSYWINNPANTTNGPLNRTGLWASTTTENQTIGFSYCLDILESKTYYVGCAADNEIIIKVDGNTLLDMDEAAMTASLYSQYSIADPNFKASFTFWNIYPIELLAGPHIIEINGFNGPGLISNVAAMGAMIYDNTPAEIVSATTDGDLNILFTTEDFRTGQPIQTGSGGIGYSCPPGYVLDSCSGPFTCKRTLTTPTIAC